MTYWSKPPAPFYLSFIICHLSLVISSAPIDLAEKLATNYTAQPSRNQIKKPITCSWTPVAIFKFVSKK